MDPCFAHFLKFKMAELFKMFSFNREKLFHLRYAKKTGPDWPLVPAQNVKTRTDAV